MAKLVLICGCGHTGSSILSRILGTHSSIYFVTQESGMFLANRFLHEEDYIKRFNSYASNENKPLILEKTPRHIWHVDYIRRKYPDSKFIITTRDGRETVASLFERSKDLTASLTRYQDDSILSLRQLGQKDTLLVRYEDLIVNPVKLINDICVWIGVDFEPKMLDYHHKPIIWNLDNPYSHNKLDAHDLLRNKQVNSPLERPIRHWSERLPAHFHAEVNGFFSEDQVGFKLMCGFGYQI
jgi:hypothetical protein